MPATSGGVSAFPIRAHECVIPCANPHFPAGVHVDIARVAVGNAGPSPNPRAIREAISEANPRERLKMVTAMIADFEKKVSH